MGGRQGVAAIFQKEVEEAFGFLVQDFGFLGPEIRASGVLVETLVYHSSDISVTVDYDDREHYAVTGISGMAGGNYMRAGLSCLYVEGGLGPAQHIKYRATTSHSLKKALLSQGTALRKILPLLSGSERNSLLSGCHAR